jgi:hypothetical protein
MSGWIKVEKELETDPRTLRMAKALAKRFNFFPLDAALDPCNAVALPAVTLVCGSLTRLWIFADSHIREDNTLDMGAVEIDEWLGIPGFCDLMPDDWLIRIGEDRVELPGFLDHNGVEAKKKALTGKRVANHRSRKAVTECNAPALPDQTRPDLDQTIKETRESAQRETESQIHAHVERIKAVYPKAARPNWIAGEKNARNVALRGDATWDELIAGSLRYAKHCEQTGRIAMDPGNFFKAEDRPWTHEWAVPAKPGMPAKGNDDAAWAEAISLAKEIGFRDPHRPAETVSAYMREVKQFRDRPPAVPLSERRGLAGVIKRVAP